MARGEFAEASALFSGEMSLNPAWKQPAFHLALCQAGAREFGAAARTFDDVELRDVTGSDEQLAVKGDVYVTLSRHEAARDAYYEAIQKSYKCWRAHAGLSLLTHFPELAIDRPAGFAPPDRAEWYRFNGFAARIRLFREQFVVITTGCSPKDVGFSLHAERVAFQIARNWNLTNPRWIHHCVHGARDWHDFTEYRFTPTTLPNQFGAPEFVGLTAAEVETLIGYRLLWRPKRTR